MIWATLMGRSPAVMVVGSPGLVLDREQSSGPLAIPSRLTDPEPHPAENHAGDADGEFADTARNSSALGDNIVGSLFGAGLSLDRLADRLSDPQDKRTLDTAVMLLDDVVRDVRLMLHAIERPN